MYYSTNNGGTWKKGFGKAATGASYPTIYIWGTVGGVEGVYRSINQGASWTRINDDAHEWGGPGNGQYVIGDMNTYGRVYISTAGRGIAYIESASVARLATTPSNVTALDSAGIKITAFPNPVNSALTIRLTEDLKGGNIFLLNSSGQLVFARKANSSLMTIEMANMPADVYSLKVEGKTRSFVKKIVKK